MSAARTEDNQGIFRPPLFVLALERIVHGTKAGLFYIKVVKYGGGFVGTILKNLVLHQLVVYGCIELTILQCIISPKCSSLHLELTRLG